MSSRDLYWYEDIVKEEFIQKHKILTLKGNNIIKDFGKNDEKAVVLKDTTSLEIQEKLNLQEIWLLENCSIDGDLIVKEDFKARNNLKIKGNIKALSIFSGHNTIVDGDLYAQEKVELGNNSIVNGNIKCKYLRVGENVKIHGKIDAKEVYAGSNFYSDSDVYCDKFMTGEHTELAGTNNIGYFYSQNGNTINGGKFIELHTDDNFRCTSSIKGNKLIMDNCAIINGNIEAEKYVRVGDQSRVNGNLACEGYFEFGPGTTITGTKKVKTEKQMPPSSAKIRTPGNVHFPKY